MGLFVGVCLLWRHADVLFEHFEVLQLELGLVDFLFIHQLSFIDPVTQLFQFQFAHDLPDHAFDLVLFVFLSVQHPVVVRYQCI